MLLPTRPCLPLRISLCIIILLLFVQYSIFLGCVLSKDHARNAGSDENQNLQLKSRKSVMIIATYPNSPVKYAAIWSHLWCFSRGFDWIVISAPMQFQTNITNFTKLAIDTIPDLKNKKIESRFFSNDRYDFGLWCDALLNKDNSNKTPIKDAGFDQFMLINDSILAVEKTNMFLEALEKTKSSLVSLSYWGEKNSSEVKYWLESPLRVFNENGMQIYMDTICSLPSIHWRHQCPYLRNNTLWKSKGSAQLTKRCIVELSEINVVDHYDVRQVHGMYKATSRQNQSWIGDFDYWLNLRKDGFPVAKVSNSQWLEKLRRSVHVDLERCTNGVFID